MGILARFARGLVFPALFASAAAVAQTPPLTPPSKLIAVQEPPKAVPRILDRATADNTRIVVSSGRQRARLYVDGEVAIDTPVSTGKKRGVTPAGEYVVLEKLPEHRSSMHGDFVDSLGRVVMAGVSTRIDAAPAGTVFRMVPQKYFMRLGPDGLALHAGRLPGYPSSDTSVRLPQDIAPLVFQRVKPGTPVKIEE